jgi:hypothetical protein
VKRLWIHFLYLLYCVEAGIFLLLAPWSLLWSHGYFAHLPAVREIVLSGYVRGGISAVGLLMIGIGTVDFIAFCRALREQ